MNKHHLQRGTRAASLVLLLAGALPAAQAAGAGGHHHAPGHEHGHAASIGKPGRAAAVQRTIEVRMSDDMRFTPAEITVRKGETVRLRVTNAGQMKHELVLGRLAALKEHAELMRKFPDMEHADPNAVSVAPGETGELVWQFTRGGKIDFACLQPGHFEAGMKGLVTVAAAAGKPRAPAAADASAK